MWQFDLQDKQPVLKYTIEYDAAWMTDDLVALSSIPDGEHSELPLLIFQGDRFRSILSEENKRDKNVQNGRV